MTYVLCPPERIRTIHFYVNISFCEKIEGERNKATNRKRAKKRKTEAQNRGKGNEKKRHKYEKATEIKER